MEKKSTDDKKSTEEKIIKAFQNDFKKIKGMGPVDSQRSHNTGVGKTFEELIGVEENNLQLADYMGFLEVKSQRDESKSMLTLFTKSPNFPMYANTILREDYGSPYKDAPTVKKLHTTVSGATENSYEKKWSFKLKIDKMQEKIFIIVKDLKTGEIVDDRTYYTFQTLKCIVEGKCQNIAYVKAKTQKDGKKEKFEYISAELLTGLSFEKFIKAIEEGIILYDIRMGAYQSGKNKGKSHDHGSGFRIKTDSYSKVFTVTKL
jgi:hypothetical protein